MKSPGTAILLLCALLVAGSACYYLVFALPRATAARLEFEKQKYLNEQKIRESEQEKKEQEKLNSQMAHRSCDLKASEEYSDFISLNGTEAPSKKGIWTTPGWVRAEADRKRQTSLTSCLTALGY
jgi:hypothetical protein